MQPMKMSFLFLVDSALQKGADNIPSQKLTAILLRSEIYRLISLPACSGTHIQGMHPLLHCISLVAIFAIIPFMPPWRQIFSSTYYPQFDNKGDIALIYTNLFSHPPGIEFPAAGAAGCNLRNLFLVLGIAVPPLKCVAFSDRILQDDSPRRDGITDWIGPVVCPLAKTVLDLILYQLPPCV